MPHSIKTERSVLVPNKVKVALKGRNVSVEGPRGKLFRSFKQSLTFTKTKKNAKTYINVTLWDGNRRSNATVRTVASHIQNMINGVQFGFVCTMKLVSAHFPINLNIAKDGGDVQ